MKTRGVRAAGQQGVAIAADDRRRVVGVELQLARRRTRVSQEARAERVVGLEREETAVEPVGRRGRESMDRS
jgi:hypothetical protein